MAVPAHRPRAGHLNIGAPAEDNHLMPSTPECACEQRPQMPRPTRNNNLHDLHAPARPARDHTTASLTRTPIPMRRRETIPSPGFTPPSVPEQQPIRPAAPRRGA
ncbi:hypothetical protein Franean1_4127 [Parafrankia sp. EAN1pec]|nr:hypothetical protein Franean1_4127 [Frankia sp. EAN1pec]